MLVPGGVLKMDIHVLVFELYDHSTLMLRGRTWRMKDLLLIIAVAPRKREEDTSLCLIVGKSGVPGLAWIANTRELLCGDPDQSKA